MCDCSTDEGMSQQLADQLELFVRPLLIRLDQELDKRLVRTFLLTLKAILAFRHGSYGLLLSELGAYILSPGKAAAGTKRLSNLLHCERWGCAFVAQFLWQRADTEVQHLREAAEDALVIWDESVLEKAESIALEGLCPVRSTQAARLKRIKPGYYNPPGGRPVFVPGMQWISALVVGPHRPPVVAMMRWWTSRGAQASEKRTEERALLQRCVQAWGRTVVHIWDRGFAGAPWLGVALEQKVRFIVRWPKRYKLVDEHGERNAWKIARGKRAWQRREIWDAKRRCRRLAGVLAVPVKHPDYDDPLWLVVCRSGQGREPWYLLTNEPIPNADAAWWVVFAYARRWQIEMSYRYGKTELAMESPRLWRWDNRLKLLFMVTLVYAFLLSLLAAAGQELRAHLLTAWCHRTGQRHREASVPLYRIRSALSRLWLAHPPVLSRAWESPG